jgi:hypothetical protein
MSATLTPGSQSTALLPHATEMVTQDAFLHHDENKFVTVGEYTMRLWKINPTTKSSNSEPSVVFSLTIAIDLKDSQVYCGTTSGDVVFCSL